MYTKAFLVSAIIVLPTVALAQRGGGGGGSRTAADKHTPMFDKQDMPKGPSLRVRDVEDMNPIKRLIDRRKDLKLTDAQVNQLKDADTKLKQTNEPLLKAVDSLLHEAKQAANNANTDEARAKGNEATQGLRSAVEQINANYDAAANEATASFDAEQQGKAKDILSKLKEDNGSMLRERLYGGASRG